MTSDGLVMPSDSRRNKSELLFEGYLRAQGLCDYGYEPQLASSSRRPDYLLRRHGRDVLFDVKEFQATKEDASVGFRGFDPYPPLREKIGAARKKFKDFKNFCCGLVLYNLNKPLVLLDWQYIYGAMLGDLGFSVPIHHPGVPAPPDTESRTVFMKGGKMIRESGGRPVGPKNTTISAVIVLERIALGQLLFMSSVRQEERERGRPLTDEEFWSRLKAATGALDLRRKPLRVVVHENPYARIPLAEDLFRGEYDERYGGREGRIQCLFRGVGVPSDDHA